MRGHWDRGQGAISPAGKEGLLHTALSLTLGLRKCAEASGGPGAADAHVPQPVSKSVHLLLRGPCSCPTKDAINLPESLSAGGQKGLIKPIFSWCTDPTLS